MDQPYFSIVVNIKSYGGPWSGYKKKNGLEVCTVLHTAGVWVDLYVDLISSVRQVDVQLRWFFR